jgi:hypothetical protein
MLKSRRVSRVKRKVSKEKTSRVQRKVSKARTPRVQRRTSRVQRKVSKARTPRVQRKSSRVQRKSSRVQRTSKARTPRVQRKSSRVQRKSSEPRAPIVKKDLKPSNQEKIKNYLIEELKPYNIRVGNFIGEGIESIVYEGFDENNKLYAVKYTKTSDLKMIEEYLYKQFNELKLKIKKNNHVISVVEYCGVSLEKSLKKDHEIINIFEDPKKALELGLEALYKFHKLKIVHTDPKLDNICIRRDKNGNVKLKLMDYGFSQYQYPYIKNVLDFIKKEYKDKYKDKYNFYDLISEGLNINHLFLPTNNRNFFTGFYKAMSYGGQTYADDIEYYIWALYYYYMMSRSKKIDFLTDSKEWLKVRIDPNNCPNLPSIFRDVLIEIRKKQNITIPELCKKLNLDCNLI